MIKRSHVLAAAGVTAGIGLSAGFVGAWTAPGHIGLRPHLINANTLRDNSVPLTGTWEVDAWHTSPTFLIHHMGLSTIIGRFDTISGTIVADEAHPENSSVNITIPVDSINTNVKMRDDDLRSDHFFDVAKYPNITFKSTSVVRDKPSHYTVTGDLTMHGVTKSIALPFTLYGPIKDPFGSPRFGLSTNLIINRLDYGVGPTDKLAGGQYAEGRDVDIVINLEATPPKPATPAPVQ